VRKTLPVAASYRTGSITSAAGDALAVFDGVRATVVGALAAEAQPAKRHTVARSANGPFAPVRPAGIRRMAYDIVDSVEERCGLVSPESIAADRFDSQ
jgi:hypothetical protein